MRLSNGHRARCARGVMTRACVVSVAVAGAIAAGCAGPLPELRTEVDIVDATGIATALTFRTEGSAPDAAPPGMPAAAHAAHLSLADALQRAVLSDPDIQAALARVQAARADAEQARLWQNPALALVLRWGVQDQHQVELNFAQALLATLQTPARARVADQRLRAAAAQALTVALDVATRLQRAYVDVQAADATVPLLTAQVELATRATDIVDSRVANGEGSEVDRSAMRARGLEAEVRLATAQLQQRAARLQLARALGEPSSPADWSLDVLPTPTAPAADEGAWVVSALQHRPELQALRWQLAALGDEHALVLWAPWQDFELGANVQRAPLWVGGPFVTVPLPVFDRGQAAADRVAAEQAEKRHQLTSAARAAIEATRAAHAAVRSHRDNLVRVQQELLPLLERRADQARAAQRLGQVDVTAVLAVDFELLLARQRRIELAHAGAVAQQDLVRAAGGVGADPILEARADHGAEER